MGLADFDINADGADQGFDGTNSQSLSFTLRASPPNGISRWLLQVWNGGSYDPTLGIAGNPPRQSKDAPLLTLVGATSGQSVQPATLASAITTTLPSSGSDAWIVRSTVNGGVNPDGSPNPEYVRERMVVVRDVNGGRKIVATETTQYESDGWAGAFTGGATGATGDSDGFLSRNVYVNAGSAHVSTTVLGQTAAAAPTWTTAGDIPAGNRFRVILYAPGVGGNGGCCTSFSNDMSGGAAGGGGARVERRYSRRELIDALPIAWGLPLGGAGGAGAESAGNGIGTVGAFPSDDATFGSLLTAYHAGRGTSPPEFGGEGGGGGAGVAGRGGNGDSSGNPGEGGDPIGGGSGGGGNNPSLFGGGSGGGLTLKGGDSVEGGGGGGGTASPGAGTAGGASVRSATGGGGGGGHDNLRTTSYGGGVGGARLNPDQAGAAVGTDGADATINQGGMGGGGGDGAVGTAPVAGMDGGNGGLGGGGGGGGGSAGSTDSGTNTGGDGGDGGDALGIVEAYL